MDKKSRALALLPIDECHSVSQGSNWEDELQRIVWDTIILLQQVRQVNENHVDLKQFRALHGSYSLDAGRVSISPALVTLLSKSADE